jgi:hypothetical protein
MALFVDGLAASLEDLAAYDSSVLAVTTTEGIDLNAKLALAHASLAVDLETVLGSGTLECVVVTSALKAFLIYSTLEHVYRDAYNSQLNDRFEGRRRQYEALRREAWWKLLESGIGLAIEPVSKSAAPELTSVPGSGVEGILYARTAWVNRRGHEGLASEASEWIGAPGATLRVRAVHRPSNASGWNVYIGHEPHETRRQNPEPLPTDAEWVKEGPIIETGGLPSDGQTADYIRAVPRLLRRG